MMNTHQRLQLATRNARRQLHGATDADNARRILRVLRQPDFHMVNARHVAVRLPAIVRAEAQAARAAAWDLELDNGAKEAAREWSRLLQKSDVLFGWADQCGFESTQRDALAALDRLFTEREKVA
jgi:hypothetical protein